MRITLNVKWLVYPPGHGYGASVSVGDIIIVYFSESYTSGCPVEHIQGFIEILHDWRCHHHLSWVFKMDIYNLVKYFTSLGKARQVYLYSTFHTQW